MPKITRLTLISIFSSFTSGIILFLGLKVEDYVRKTAFKADLTIENLLLVLIMAFMVTFIPNMLLLSLVWRPWLIKRFKKHGKSLKPLKVIFLGLVHGEIILLLSILLLTWGDRAKPILDLWNLSISFVPTCHIAALIAGSSAMKLLNLYVQKSISLK